MTHQVNYPTKKAFKEAVLANPDSVYLDDPSFFDPVSGSVTEILNKKNKLITVTNFNKRSWFASVYYKNGEIKVD